MKNVLIGVILLNSPFAMSMTQFEQQISINSTLLNGSKNYEAKYINDDATVSIVGPKFSDPTGESSSLTLSNDSDLNGVCKLFGQGTYVQNSMLVYNSGNTGLNVVIGSDGRFSSFMSQSVDNAIKSIVCSNNAAPKASDNYASISVNDDGTKTLRNPHFMINGKNLSLSNDSNFDGVCKLFGQRSYVQNSMLGYNSGNTGLNVVIGSDGRFSSFMSQSTDSAIKSIMCN